MPGVRKRWQVTADVLDDDGEGVTREVRLLAGLPETASEEEARAMAEMLYSAKHATIVSLEPPEKRPPASKSR